MVIGVILGSIAGYFRGWTDTIISRVTEITMAFPLLLFIVALAATIGAELERDHVRRDLPQRGRHACADLHHLRLVLPGKDHARAGALDPREGVHRGGPHDRRQRLPDHPLARAAAPDRADDRLLDADRRRATSSPRPASRSSALGIKLPTASWGNLLADAPELLHDAAVTDALAGPRGAADDARVQPARRRAPRRVRPALQQLARGH